MVLVRGQIHCRSAVWGLWCHANEARLSQLKGSPTIASGSRLLRGKLAKERPFRWRVCGAWR